MDVRFFPAPPSSVGSCTLPSESGLDYYHSNKSRYGVADRGVRLYSSLPMRPNPDGKRLPSTGFDGDNMYMNENNHDFLPPNQMQEMALHHHQHHHQHPDSAHYDPGRSYPLLNHSPPMLTNPMRALSQLNSQVSRSALPHGSPSPPGSKSATPSPSSSNQEEETDPHLKMTGEKRMSSEMMKPKPKPPKKKKKKDPNEPTKPVSAYALFFRDTQAAIKGQNPNATFGDVSKIVASMWDGLGEEQKQNYKRKTEAAKKEYLKALAAYRASLVSKTYNDPVETKNVQTSQHSPHMMPANTPLYSVPPPPQPSSPYLGPGAFPLTDLQSYAGHAPRHALSQTLSQSQMLPSISASPPSSFQISPPLHPHQQLSLHQSSLLNQPIRMQQSQPIIPHQMGLQASLHSPPPGQQGFSHLQSEYQKSIGGPQSPGAPGPGPGPGVAQTHDWDSEYCNRECGNHCSGSMIGRDKPLYLT
uniref:HMG box domain-containing protein n=1 Tax=Gouania willdenowi TaxID=441366 RepID=A0A8C5I123_GOUWI